VAHPIFYSLDTKGSFSGRKIAAIGHSPHPEPRLIMHGATHIYALMGNRDFTVQVFDTIVIYFEMSTERTLHESHEICRGRMGSVRRLINSVIGNTQ
jgi:hypothetical protein